MRVAHHQNMRRLARVRVVRVEPRRVDHVEVAIT